MTDDTETTLTLRTGTIKRLSFLGDDEGDALRRVELELWCTTPPYEAVADVADDTALRRALVRLVGAPATVLERTTWRGKDRRRRFGYVEVVGIVSHDLELPEHGA